GPGADHAAMAFGARPSLRIAADLRPGADHPGRVPELLWLVRLALFYSRRAEGRHESRVHVPADLSRLGRGVFADRMPADLVSDRADEAGGLSARRHRKSNLGARLRRQRASNDYAHLRPRSRSRRLGWRAIRPDQSSPPAN